MSLLPVRSKSAHPSRNVANVHLHACLDQAHLYSDQISHHLSQSAFPNHTLQSAERIYRKQIQQGGLRHSKVLAKSTTSLGKPSNLVGRLKTGGNPENIMEVFSMKAQRVSELKLGLSMGDSTQIQLRNKMKWLRDEIARQKTRKYKLSLNNSKHMNQTQLSNRRIRALQKQSYRNNIAINEAQQEETDLSGELIELRVQNSDAADEIRRTRQIVCDLSERVRSMRRELGLESRELQSLKGGVELGYKQMTNDYMLMNRRMQEQALLLNCIDSDTNRTS